MSLIFPNFDVKLIIFPNFGQGPFPKIARKSPVLVLQSSGRGRESWLIYFNCLPDALCMLVFVAFPHGTVSWSAVCDCGIS